jgi:Ni,Fe-hydrogenase III large subunit
MSKTPSILADLIAPFEKVAAHKPYARVRANAEGWRRAGDALQAGDLTLLGLWGEPGEVHLALLDEKAKQIAVLSLDCPEASFPSVGVRHPPAVRLERAIQDLFGLAPAGAADLRPWLDHGQWGVSHPLGRRKQRETLAAAASYPFLPVEGEGLHQIPVGPVHAGIIEPGHFRFTANGETVARLEERLGYVHKGVEGLMAGAEIAHAAKLAGRTSGDSAVAYAYAFARAVEAALGMDAPPRAIWLRALMAELERLANHFGDIGAICNDAAFSLMHAHCAILRERVLRAADSAFGHRLMRDCIIPGGVACEAVDQVARLGKHARDWRRRFATLVELYDETTSLQDRTVATGVLRTDLAHQFGAGGFVGRASGRAFDTRSAFAYPPYDVLDFNVPVLDAGDVDARVWIRIREVEQSLSLVEQIVETMPQGPLNVPTSSGAGEGLALAEGFRGDILVWVRLADDGRVSRCHLRDPSWFQWPLLEAAIENNIVGDFPLCNKSFNCSYSGHDL